MNAKGKRYSKDEKQEVLDYVTQYNEEHHGRGGVTHASRHFGITQMTINAWIRKEKNPAQKSSKPTKVGNIFQQLGDLQEHIEEKEAELSLLREKFETLKKTG